MAMGRVESISQSYQANMDNNPVGLVVAGMVFLIVVMVAGHFISAFMKRRRLEKRAAERRKEKARSGGY